MTCRILEVSLAKRMHHVLQIRRSEAVLGSFTSPHGAHRQARGSHPATISPASSFVRAFHSLSLFVVAFYPLLVSTTNAADMAFGRTVEEPMWRNVSQTGDSWARPLYLRGRSLEGHVETLRAGDNVEQGARAVEPAAEPKEFSVPRVAGTGTEKRELRGETKTAPPTSPGKLGPFSEDDILFVSEKVREFIRREGESVELRNDWRLIEESWQRVELFRRNATEYFRQGFGLQVDDAGRLMATVSCDLMQSVTHRGRVRPEPSKTEDAEK